MKSTHLIYEDRNGVTTTYTVDQFKQIKKMPTEAKRSALFRVLHETFLPSGYPSSVSSDYASYQFWDSLQAGASSLNGVLATRAMLHAVGVGNAHVLPTTAALNWIMKDGVGMLSRIVFGWAKGTDLDNNCKFWRLFADVVNDVAFMIDLLSPSFPSLVLPLVCVGSVLKSVVGVAGGATRSAITEHQARRSNMADVSAKDASQEVAVALMGLIIGYMITPLIDSDFKTWLCFSILTVLHLGCNYMAVTSVIMDKFNRQRFDIVVQHYLSVGTIMTPDRVASMEALVYNSPFPIHLGCSLQDAVRRESSTAVFQSLSSQRYHITTNDNHCYVLLHRHISHKQILEAYFEAFQLTQYGKLIKPFEPFERSLLRYGWNTTAQLLGAGEWRYGTSRLD